jgi:phage virion morphogenesis protein
VIKVAVDDADARRLLDGLFGCAADTEKLLAQAGRNLVRKARDGFQAGRDPSGVAWAPHAKLTTQLRARRGSTSAAVLFDDGTLFSSLASETDASGVTVRIGGDGLWANVHQFGLDPSYVFGRQVGRIPKRPMLPEADAMPADWWDAALGPFDDALKRALKGKA